jgi:type II secretory pathway component PulK
MGNKRRGGILVITLVILAVTTAILAVTAANQEVRSRATINRLEQTRARMAAESGIRRGIAALATQDPNQVTFDGDWYTLGNSAADSFALTSGDHFRIQIIDAASLVSINTATQDMLLNLGLTTEQADSLLDWREPGETPRPEGAKDEYYNNLDTPYNTKLARLDGIDELMLVKGFDPQSVYQALDQSGNTIRNTDTAYALYQMITTDSFSPNVGSNGQQKQDINGVQANQLTQQGIPPQVAAAIIARRNGLGQFATMQQVLQTPGLTTQSAGPLIDNFTVGAAARVEGRINLNTGTESVLAAIPGFTQDITNSIVSRQTNGGFTALSELLTIPGITVQVMAGAVDQIAVGSDTFVIRVIGTAGQTSVGLEGIVRLVNNQPVLEKVSETPLRDMRALWNWQDDTTNEVDING